MSYGAGAVRGGMWGMRLGALLGPLGAAVGTVVGAAGGIAVTAGLAYLGKEAISNQMSKADGDAEKDLDDEEDGGPCSGCGDRTLPDNPDDLVEEGWVEEPDRAPGRRRFRDPETGEELIFDEGRPGQPGWEGRDHYHRPNPNAPGKKKDFYLDKNGNPVNKGSGASHISPGTTITNGSNSGPTS